jgi:CBS domain-containing protein/mannitol/fructose-specific phosphotransferase system IIA component (Ntr-type)
MPHVIQLGSIVRREHIVIPLHAATVQEAIDEMLARLASAGAVLDADAVAHLVIEARARGVIAIGDVALSHLRTEAVQDLVLAIGVSSTPLEHADSGLAADPLVIVLLLAPPGASTLYLQTVATLARLLRDTDLARQLRSARSAEDVLALDALRDAAIHPTLTVRDLMGQRQSVAPETPVREAVDLMIRDNLKALPVVGDKGEVRGIVTGWDVMRAVLPQIPGAGETLREGTLVVPADLLVRDIMTRSVLCVSEEMGLAEVANIMVNKDVEQFPVVAEGKLTGFLSRADMIRKLFAR